MRTAARTPEEPPQRIIAADPVWALVEQLRAEAKSARAIRDERFAAVQEEAAARLEAAIREGAELQDVSTTDAAPVLGIEPESVATACRRGRIPGARKIAGQWRIPVRTLDRGKAA